MDKLGFNRALFESSGDYVVKWDLDFHSTGMRHWGTVAPIEEEPLGERPGHDGDQTIIAFLRCSPSRSLNLLNYTIQLLTTVPPPDRTSLGRRGINEKEVERRNLF